MSEPCPTCGHQPVNLQDLADGIRRSMINATFHVLADGTVRVREPKPDDK